MPNLRIMGFYGVIVFMVFCLGLYSNAERDQRSVLAKRITSPPRIDGSLDEKIWGDLPVIKDFFQYSPYNDQLATQQTEVKIGYDDRALYIGAICYDRSPQKITRGISIRDQFPPGMNVDIFAILISPYNDGLNSVFLYVTAAGVQRDVKFFGDQHDLTWDAVWDSEVKITPFGWVVEMKVPLSVFRFPTQSVQNWGLNLWFPLGKRMVVGLMDNLSLSPMNTLTDVPLFHMTESFYSICVLSMTVISPTGCLQRSLKI